MPSQPCPSRAQLTAFMTGRLFGTAREAVAGHLDACPVCQASLQSLANADDSLQSALRGPVPADPFSQELQCQEVFAHVAAAVRQAVAAGDQALGKLGKYKLLAELGRGGMGIVYRARHGELDKEVALKELAAKHTSDPQSVARFQREMRAAGQLEHPNVVRTTDADAEGGRYFLVMELVEGLNLSEVVQRHGPLAVADACDVIRQAALGLQHIHEHGLVHRDVKPSNLRLTLASDGPQITGCVKVLDLGLASFRYDDGPLRQELTASGSILGTADYMAPEQGVDPHRVDIRADLYSLGCTLFFLLAGQPPFGGAEYSTRDKKLMAHAQAPVPPIRKQCPETPEELARLLDRLLAKKPDGRFATPAEVARTLQPFCAGSNLALLLKESKTPGEATIAVLPPVAAPPRRRWRLLVLGAVAASVVLAALAWSWWPFGPHVAGTGKTVTKSEVAASVLPLTAKMFVQVSENKNPLRQSLYLHQPLALPLKTGDSIQVTVELSRAGYLYLVWIDSKGEATPLEPWPDNDWGKLPVPEQRRDRLAWLGEDLGNTPTGIEALLLLVREEPLPAGTDMAGLFKGLAKQQGATPSSIVAWFENGELVRDDSYRGPPNAASRTVLDPVLQTQDLLRGRLRELFPSTKAVCFSFQGNNGGG